MKTVHRLWLVFAIVLLGIACRSVASAQGGAKGAPTLNPGPSDFFQLPYSVLLVVAPPAGWQGTSQMWLTAIWNRNAPGAWYRNPAWPNDGRPSAAYLNSTPSMGTTAYTCYAEAGFRFRCRDNIRALNRYYSCPTSINFSPTPLQWRSQFQLWPQDQVGWFYWRSGAESIWGVATDNRNWISPIAHFVDTNGKRLNCQYNWPQVVDVWIFKR